ncbi:hypothetical protein M422DRAFT_776289 [Sphaerobolus stellatus SS14]|nr:hypothetical protein M422DRAFT_776289 [Sphaerobolus stellatus SS14]
MLVDDLRVHVASCRVSASSLTRDYVQRADLGMCIKDGLSVVSILYYYVNSSHADIKRHVLPTMLLSPLSVWA